MAILIGLIVGIVLGLTGAGGSVFAVPLLMVVLGLPAQQAIGLSLGAVALSSFIGVMIKWKSGLIQWLPAAIFAGVGALFTPLGFYLNGLVDETYLMLAFSILVLIIAARMWNKADSTPKGPHSVRAGFSDNTHSQDAICVQTGQPFKLAWPCIKRVVAGAIITGILSGLFGVGGGFIIVPTLIMLTAMSIQQAVASSLLIISVISSSGFISFLMSNNTIDYSLLLQIIIGSLAGMLVGIPLSKKIAGANLQKIFSVLMVFMAILTILTNITSI